MQSCKELMVAVYMITYNHEHYIENSIRSVLSQKTNFNFKLFIGEDCSSDKTKEICIKYKSLYPNKIELICREKNIGVKKNAIETFNRCFQSSATYVALCEGDDYWTDLLKLQKQVDFLETTQDASGCFHNSICVDGFNKIIDKQYFKKTKKESYTQEECLKELHSSYSTGSLVFRSIAIKDQLDDFSQIGSDFILDLMLTNHGKLYYLNENMSAYRIHSGGIWQGNTDSYNLKVILSRFLFLFNTKPFNNRYNHYLWEHIMKYYSKLISLSESEKEKGKYKKEQYKFLNYTELRTFKFLFSKLKDSLRYRIKIIKAKRL